MAKRIKKDDLVVVIAGRDKGSQGRVLRVIEERDRVIVEGVNVVKRHSKPTQQNQTGGIIEKEASIHISNVMPFDTKSEKPTRVRAGQDKDGKKVRIAAKSGTVLDS
jgi:large subunit ribosomal protein L24